MSTTEISGTMNKVNVKELGKCSKESWKILKMFRATHFITYKNCTKRFLRFNNGGF